MTSKQSSSEICQLIDGFEICDPELVNLIMRYNLHLLAAPPPGIAPIEVGSIEELKELLEELPYEEGGHINPLEGVVTPGPYDPGIEMIIWDPGGGGDTGDNGAETDIGTGENHDKLQTSPPTEPHIGTFRFCKCLAPESAPTRFCPTANLCIEVDALYIPVMHWELANGWVEAIILDDNETFFERRRGL